MSSMGSDNTPTFETTPKRPYLVRAFYDWIVDNGLTPHVLVKADMDNVQVPQSYVKDGSIVLNLSPGAVHDWYMDNDAISFSARFNGSAFPIYLPMPAIMAIYARENQDGLSFHEAEYAAGTASGSEDANTGIRVVTSDDASDNSEDGSVSTPAISAVDTTSSADSASSGTEGDDNDAPAPKRPTLRVVK